MTFCLRATAALWCAMLAATPTTHAQDKRFPTEPITMVVGFAAGGITDSISRQVAAELQHKLGQPVVIENRGGAGGQVATEYMKRQNASGHALLVAASGYAMAPAQKKVGYDPLKDFAPVALFGIAPNLLVVHPSVPAKSLPEFLAWAKKLPSVPYGSAGTGGANHLAGEIFKHLSGAPLTHIPYRGAAPAAADLIAGSVPVAFIDAMTIGPFIAAGKARALAQTGGKRSALYPDLPTIAESGFADFDVSVWMGVFAPAGAPAAVVNTLNQAVRDILKSPEVANKLKASGVEPESDMTAARFADFVRSDVARWQKVMKETGLKLDN